MAGVGGRRDKRIDIRFGVVEGDDGSLFVVGNLDVGNPCHSSEAFPGNRDCGIASASLYERRWTVNRFCEEVQSRFRVPIQPAVGAPALKNLWALAAQTEAAKTPEGAPPFHDLKASFHDLEGQIKGSSSRFKGI
jgi:hypothetical protein